MNIKVPDTRKRSLPEIEGQRKEGIPVRWAWRDKIKKADLHAESTHTCM
jgi:hypothetical protein